MNGVSQLTGIFSDTVSAVNRNIKQSGNDKDTLYSFVGADGFNTCSQCLGLKMLSPMTLRGWIDGEGISKLYGPHP